jgi:hypothetical protein
MAKKKHQERRANEEVRAELPPGVKLLRTLEGHTDAVTSVAFDPQRACHLDRNTPLPAEGEERGI